jgi:hypothetical protein
MHRLATILVASACGALMLGAAPAVASSLQERSAPTKATDVSAQSRTKVRPRARTRVLVYPRYPYRTFHTFYPLPYPVEYPGPGAVRHCVSNLVQEHRLSGTVLVPRVRCWWARG